MKNIIFKRFCSLFSIKSIVTLVLTGVFAYQTINGRIEPQEFMTVYTVVIAFYFGTQSQKNQHEVEKLLNNNLNDDDIKETSDNQQDMDDDQEEKDG